MIIDLRELFKAGDGSKEFSDELDFSGVELGGAKPFCAPVRVFAKLRSFAGAVELHMDVVYRLTIPCDRCAEIFSRDYSKSFFHTLVREISGQDDDEFIIVPTERLDLDGLVLEDILLDISGQFLCRADCKGLCPVCGKNLNEGPCRCGGFDIDPRLEILQQLL